MSAHSSETSGRTENDRRLVVSFHDLHPGTRSVCARFLNRLASLGINRTTLLVVPRWHGAPAFTRDGEFTNWLRDLAHAGHEICLHGFFHRAESVTGGMLNQFVGRHYTAGEGEFYQINEEAADDLVGRGLDILKTEAGLPVTGFTPPAWLLSEGGRRALIRAGLTYTTTFSGVESLQSGAHLAAPTVVWSCRSAWRRLVSRAWVRFWARRHRTAPVLRIAVHPGDFQDPRVKASVYARIEESFADNRSAVAYSDLVDTPDDDSRV